MYQQLNQYHVIMEVAQDYQNDPAALSNIYVKSNTGAQIPLSAVTHLVTDRVPLAINHQSLVAGRHAVVQPCAQRLALAGHRRH